MNNWEDLGYESEEDYNDAYIDYIVHEQLIEEVENELQGDS